ncbi:MAG: YebC/PmpR family DNA-binding transcriptional regulator [Armatimonadetes bacterium]|nr:YebC/PmpR family DNA-binding transcriptional regulator [Armatimonadota bacterium]
MSGHSKWSTIKRQKGRKDVLRSKLFTRLAREIIVAAKIGGGDPSGNARLRVAIDKAKSESLPKENIERAIKRGTGEIEGEHYEEITYECVGPGGVGIMIDCFSENRNRTVSEIRHALSRNNGNLTENGSVSWQFKQVGQILVKKEGVDEDSLMLAAIDGGAEDVITDDEEFFVVVTAADTLHKCSSHLAEAGFTIDEANLTRIATNKSEPTDDELRKVVRLLEALEELDDVKDTHVNADIPEEIYQEA